MCSNSGSPLLSGQPNAGLVLDPRSFTLKVYSVGLMRSRSQASRLPYPVEVKVYNLRARIGQYRCKVWFHSWDACPTPPAASLLTPPPGCQAKNHPKNRTGKALQNTPFMHNIQILLFTIDNENPGN